MSDIRGKLARHEPLVTQQLSDPRYVGIEITDLRELWELAHEAVHPPEEEDDGPEIERGYDSVSLRMQCLQSALNMEVSKMNISNEVSTTDPVMVAEAYYAFLTAKDDV